MTTDPDLTRIDADRKLIREATAHILKRWVCTTRPKPTRQFSSTTADGEGEQMTDDDEVYLEDNDRETCEWCGAEIDQFVGDFLECSACYRPGCPKCLTEWDDVYPYLCSECQP